jgi:hypothetical protein
MVNHEETIKKNAKLAVAIARDNALQKASNG